MVQKSLKTPLRNIKIAPYPVIKKNQNFLFSIQTKICRPFSYTYYINYKIRKTSITSRHDFTFKKFGNLSLHITHSIQEKTCLQISNVCSCLFRVHCSTETRERLLRRLSHWARKVLGLGVYWATTFTIGRG